METVEVVIKIPEDIYVHTQEYEFGGFNQINNAKIFNAIKKGIVLPKGHDALLDARQLMDYCHNQIEGHKYVDCNVIARFPCVVKADKDGDTDDTDKDL